MTYEDKISAVWEMLVKYTYPKEQCGFVTERHVCEEILKSLGIYQ